MASAPSSIRRPLEQLASSSVAVGGCADPHRRSSVVRLRAEPGFKLGMALTVLGLQPALELLSAFITAMPGANSATGAFWEAAAQGHRLRTHWRPALQP